jgi:hypothetical protein
LQVASLHTNYTTADSVKSSIEPFSSLASSLGCDSGVGCGIKHCRFDLAYTNVPTCLRDRGSAMGQAREGKIKIFGKMHQWTPPPSCQLSSFGPAGGLDLGNLKLRTCCGLAPLPRTGRPPMSEFHPSSLTSSPSPGASLEAETSRWNEARKIGSPRCGTETRRRLFGALDKQRRPGTVSALVIQPRPR